MRELILNNENSLRQTENYLILNLRHKEYFKEKNYNKEIIFLQALSF